MKSRKAMKTAVDSGPEEKKRMAKQHAARLPKKKQAADTEAKKEETAGGWLTRKIYGEGAPASSWKWPCFASAAIAFLLLAAGVGISTLLNDLGWQLKGVAFWLVVIVLLLAIVGSKLAKTTDLLSSIREVPPELRRVRASRTRWSAVFVACCLGVALVKCFMWIPDGVAALAVAALDIANCFLIACCACVALIHWKVGHYVRAARVEADAAEDYQAAIDALDDDEDDDDDDDDDPPPSSNGSGKNRVRTATGSAIASAFIAAQIALAPHSSAEATTLTVPSVGGSAVVSAFAAALVLAPNANAGAKTLTVPVFVDVTASVDSVDRASRLTELGEGLPRALASKECAVRVSLCRWTGTARASRAPTSRWAFDSLAVPECRSPFPQRCKFIRDQAVQRMARQRAPVLASLADSIKHSADASLMTGVQTCIWSLLWDAQVLGHGVVVTDAQPSLCFQKWPGGGHAERVLVIVVASRADRAPQDLLSRVTKLRALGFQAIDGRELADFDWDAFLAGGGR